MFCYLLRLLSGVNDTLTIACIWVFRTRGTLRCDVTPALALTRFTQTNVTFVTPFGSTKIASIGHCLLRNPNVRYTTGFRIAFFYINTCQFCHPFSLPLFGLRSGVKPSIRYLHWSVRTRRSLRYAMSVILNPGSFTYK